MKFHEKSFLDSKLESLNEKIVLDKSFFTQSRHKFLQKLKNDSSISNQHFSKKWVKNGIPIFVTLLLFSVVSVFTLNQLGILNISLQNSNTNSNKNNEVINFTLPDEINLNYKPLNLEIVPEISSDSVEELVLSEQYMIDLEIFLNYYSTFDEDNNFIGLRGVIKHREKLYDLGLLSTIRSLSNQLIHISHNYQFETNNGLIKSIGTFGTRDTGFHSVFFNENNETFYTYHHFGELNDFNNNPNFFMIADHDLVLIRANNGQLEKASIKEAISNGNNHIDENLDFFFSTDLMVVSYDNGTGIVQKVYSIKSDDDEGSKLYPPVEISEPIAEMMWNNQIYVITNLRAKYFYLGLTDVIDYSIGKIENIIDSKDKMKNGDVIFIDTSYDSPITDIYKVKNLDEETALVVQIGEKYYYAFPKK